jgi:hypothetical protein
MVELSPVCFIAAPEPPRIILLLERSPLSRALGFGFAVRKADDMSQSNMDIHPTSNETMEEGKCVSSKVHRATGTA